MNEIHGPVFAIGDRVAHRYQDDGHKLVILGTVTAVRMINKDSVTDYCLDYDYQRVAVRADSNSAHVTELEAASYQFSPLG